MSSPTQAKKFIEIHNETVGALGLRRWVSGRACPFFMSSDQQPWRWLADTWACVELDHE